MPTLLPDIFVDTLSKVKEAPADPTPFGRRRSHDSLFKVDFHNDVSVENGHVSFIVPFNEQLDATEQPLVRHPFFCWEGKKTTLAETTHRLSYE